AERQHLRAWLEDFMQREVRPALLAPLRRESAPQPVQLVGTGGTSTILARIAAGLDSFDRSRIEAAQLGRNQVRECADHLWSLPLEAREKITGLPPKRADIILAGVLIYESIMQAFDFPSLRVSTRGLRFAAVLDSAQRHLTAPPSEAR
ncbi:MAG TPA: hypothetical protein VMS21_03540, partial [Methylomirabilota bacterium]|nr:hypothetical protein [Methylomirabilota bacterium]